MDSQNKSPLFESKTLLAIVAMGFIFLGWQYYLQTKYPNYYKPKPTAPVAQSSATNTPEKATDSESSAEVNAAQPKSLNEAAPIQEKKFNIDTPEFTAELSSVGMSLSKIKLKKHVDREKNPMLLGSGKQPAFQTRIIGAPAPISFDVEQLGPFTFLGRANHSGTRITKKLELDREKGFWNVEVLIDEVTPNFPGLQTLLSDKRTIGHASFFAPSLEHQEVVFSSDDSVQRIYSSSDIKPAAEGAYKGVSFAAISLRYFTVALMDYSTILPELQVQVPEVEGEDVLLSVFHKVPMATTSQKLEYKMFAGPKSMEVLAAVDPKLKEIVDLGFFASIGSILRSTLQWFFNYVGNWGVAIILLTIVVRIVVLPFNIISYRSMRAMQQIQPAMTAVREKYKDDPAAMQRETMALMKEHKVNPLGGCLPMLLQMPVFFALFQLLNVSVELYQAPFYLWITDLSVKDPFYVLPVLIGGLIYIQQQLTPAPMDPAQAKILKWMPLLFVGFMVALPAGLSIYTLVNTLFGVIQQYIFMRKSDSSVKVTSGILKEKRV